MKAIAIVQARMGSSRLPGKVLMPLGGKPSIQWVIDRARLVKGVEKVVLATTTAPCDDQLADYCIKNNIPLYRGSEPDVLDRFYQAAVRFGAEAVMRITGDCPLLDPEVSSRVLAAFLSQPMCDYASNVCPPSFPDGMDTEVVRFSTLEWLWKNVAELPYREHVTYYIRRHAEKFKTTSVVNNADCSKYRLTLDESADYNLLGSVIQELDKRRQFGYLHEVISILGERPEYAELNRHIGRDEGLAKSLRDNPLSK